MTSKERFIVLVDNDCTKVSDAIILLEGDGLNRYQHAIDLYNQGAAGCIVFSGGITNYEYGSFPYEDVLPHILKTGFPVDKLIHEDRSLNTREQAVEIVKLAKKNNWKRLILVASNEHQYRAYLTFLKEILISDALLILYNSPVRNLKWFEETGWGLRFNRLESEFEKIDTYKALGNIATFEEAISYQKWKEEQA
ncbi:MAG: hypothetical protein RL059_387 [Bacteroidota bacterium]|jgi:uncharacterized SAM-binding protein YcdF (DUF218 family)